MTALGALHRSAQCEIRAYIGAVGHSGTLLEAMLDALECFEADQAFTHAFPQRHVPARRTFDISGVDQFGENFVDQLIADQTLAVLRKVVTLVLFYAEELKRMTLSLIQRTDSLRARLTKDGSFKERVPEGSKNAVDKALNALVADGALTAEDKTEIVSLIDYRNLIGHQTHNLFVDISTAPYAKEILYFTPDRAKEFDYTAVERFQHFLSLLGNAFRTHHYVSTVNMNRLVFQSTERALLDDIKQLKRKVKRLYSIRSTKIDDLNAELKLAHGQFSGDLDPRHPLNHYDDKRMTKRGVEICYRLFDGGFSDVATAHLMGISLLSIRKRRGAWSASGGAARMPVDIAALPRRKFYRTYGD